MNHEKNTYQNEFKRIENENLQLRLQKAHLKDVLDHILVNPKQDESNTAHIDKLKRIAATGLDILTQMEERFK